MATIIPHVLREMFARRVFRWSTFRVDGPDGRKIAAYRFADPVNVKFRQFDGRTGLSKEIKDKLIEKYGCRCFIYLEEVDQRDLQIDHRVPYEVGGDTTN